MSLILAKVRSQVSEDRPARTVRVDVQDFPMFRVRIRGLDISCIRSCVRVHADSIVKTVVIMVKLLWSALLVSTFKKLKQVPFKNIHIDGNR